MPRIARDRLLDALTIVAEGGTPAIAKPLSLAASVRRSNLPHRPSARAARDPTGSGASV